MAGGDLEGGDLETVGLRRVPGAKARYGKDAGAGSCGERGGRARAGLALAGLIVAGTAQAHDEAVPLPPRGDYAIRWYQPHNAVPIADWEIEVTPQRYPRGVYVTTARAFADPSCWALDVPTSEPASVRIRAVVGNQVSAWSRHTAVPEPAVGLGLTAAVGGLVAIARRRDARCQRGSR
ncbi:MAG: hypothetical protein R3F35_05780 [Myxococcota bacterium]